MSSNFILRTLSLISFLSCWSIAFLKRAHQKNSVEFNFKRYQPLCHSSPDIIIPTEIIPVKFSGIGDVLLSCPGEFNHFLIKVNFIYKIYAYL